MNLFKYSKPIIRHFNPISEDNPGDVPYIWDAYKKGIFDLPEDLTMDEFVEFTDAFQQEIEEMKIIEDKVDGEVVPVGLIVGKNDGWLLEPHVLWFGNATPRIKYRVWVGFLKNTKYRKDIGACLIRVAKKDVDFTNRLEKMGLVEYVGKVWGGRPSGNEYLYSIRCGRKSQPIIVKPNMTRH